MTASEQLLLGFMVGQLLDAIKPLSLRFVNFILVNQPEKIDQSASFLLTRVSIQNSNLFLNLAK